MKLLRERKSPVNNIMNNRKGFDTVRRKITLLQILFLCVFVGCGIYLIKFNYDKTHTEREIEQLQEMVDEGSDKTEQPDNLEITLDDAQEDTTNEESYEPNGMLTRYYELYKQNNDMIGWIKISGTKIDYPVMYNDSNNVYYLHRNFYKEKSSSGVPYLDYQCNLQNWSDNLIIYAHNMKNGTMFHELLDYQTIGFWENHKVINFDTLYNRCEYEVFAAFRTAVGADDEFKYYDFINAESKYEFDEFVQKCKDKSLYDTKITPEYGETLLTLSTCSYNVNDERFVVVARQISKR